jgi:hypothetical protein
MWNLRGSLSSYLISIGRNARIELQYSGEARRGGAPRLCKGTSGPDVASLCFSLFPLCQAGPLC